MSMSSNILSARFDNGDFECWLREFDACRDANGWKVAEDRDDKILPAFLRGEAASHFYAIPAAKCTTYKDAVAELRKSLCPAAQRETFFAQFEVRSLRTGEDPAVYKWELEQMLDTADPDLSTDAKTALVQRQFMKGLPNVLKFKLLEPNPTPTLEEMLSFTQRYRAAEGYVQPVGNDVAAVHSTAEKDQSQLSQLVAMVAGIAEKQQSLADRLAKAEKANTDNQNDRRGRRPGHYSRDCRRKRQPMGHQAGRPTTCFSCGQLGHISRDCRAPLNY